MCAWRTPWTVKRALIPNPGKEARPPSSVTPWPASRLPVSTPRTAAAPCAVRLVRVSEEPRGHMPWPPLFLLVRFLFPRIQASLRWKKIQPDQGVRAAIEHNPPALPLCSPSQVQCRPWCAPGDNPANLEPRPGRSQSRVHRPCRRYETLQTARGCSIHN